jgi:hypothetical protein
MRGVVANANDNSAARCAASTDPNASRVTLLRVLTRHPRPVSQALIAALPSGLVRLPDACGRRGPPVSGSEDSAVRCIAPHEVGGIGRFT